MNQIAYKALIGFLFFSLTLTVCGQDRFGKVPADNYRFGSKRSLVLEAPYDIDLPIYTEQCGNDLDRNFEYDEAKHILDSLFLSHGLILEQGQRFVHDSISFELTGFNTESKIGYVWVDWASLDSKDVDKFWYDYGEAYIPDVQAEYSDDLFYQLNSFFGYGEEIDHLIDLTAKETDEVKRQALFSKVNEGIILSGTTFNHWTATEQLEKFHSTYAETDKREFLNDLLAYQKIQILVEDMSDRSPFKSQLEAVFDTLQVVHAISNYPDIKAVYDNIVISSEEIAAFVANESKMPARIIFLQSYHPANTIPNSRDYTRFYNKREHRKHNRLDKKKRYREKHSDKLLELYYKTEARHRQEIVRVWNQKIIAALNR